METTMDAPDVATRGIRQPEGLTHGSDERRVGTRTTDPHVRTGHGADRGTDPRRAAEGGRPPAERTRARGLTRCLSAVPSRITAGTRGARRRRDPPRWRARRWSGTRLDARRRHGQPAQAADRARALQLERRARDAPRTRGLERIGGRLSFTR